MLSYVKILLYSFLDGQGQSKYKQVLKHWLAGATYGRGIHSAPKVLGDVVEALIGAVFIDCHRDLVRTWKVVERMMDPLVAPDEVPLHPTVELQVK